MSSPIVNCPLCFQPAFSSLTALSMSLINVASRSLDCPVCQECLPGLDKFTIHIFGHALNHQISHKTQHNGVLKVVASNSGHNVMPIDIPVYIRQIDDSANNSFLEKAASDFKDSRLFSPNNDDNNYNVIESKSSGNKMYKTTQKCENNNVESIINNNDRQSSINCGNTMYKTALEYENNNVESITTNNSNSHISINCESNNLKSIITDHNSQISIKYDGNVLIYNPTLRCSDDDNKDKYSNNKIKTIGSNDDGITITLENVDNTEKGCYTSIKSNDSLTCVTSDNNTTISDDNLGYSQDNSNDLIKNLEPYIKYGVDNFKKNSNQSFVERSLNDEGSSMGCVENTSNLVQTSEIYGTENFNEKNSSQRFVERISNDGASATDCGMDQEMSCMVQNSSNLLQTCKNDKSFSNLTGMRCLDVGETSNKVVSSDQKLAQTCKNDQSFSKLTAMQCLDVDEISNKVVNPCRNDSDDGNNSYEPVFSKSLESFGECNTLASENINVDKQYEVVVPLVFEAESICGLKNDGMKTKSSKKYVKRKFRKKSLDSTMTTQGVQTMEESFTKNNNPFGKFSTIDKRCEDFVQELNMEGNNLVSGSVSGTNIDAVAVRSASIVTDTIRSANMDSVAIICANSNSVENENSTFCELCLFSFPDRNILQMHKNLVHGDCDGELKKTFSCHLCSKSFNMRGSLMVHRRVAHPVLSGGQVSLRNIERIKEMKASTSNDEASPQFSCKTCEKSFKKEQHLTQHERTHEVKQWECDICSKVFSTKYFLKKHKRLHTGEMPYTCAMCGKSFTFQQSYHKHLLYHSDEKPHVCCQCGRAFKELSTLHNHQRIHTGEKPFACETCGKCFRQRVSYLVHRRIHTGVMPYKCTICNKSFRYKVSERTHKCNNATPGHVVDKMNDVVEKLQKMEEINTKSKQDLSVSISCASGSSHSSNLETASCREETHLDDLQQENQCLNPTLSGAQPNKLSCEKIVESIQEFWTDISKPSTSSGQREASSDENIFSAESSDFLSFVLTPSFSPSEQFQNLTLSPDSAQNRGRGIENTEGDTISNSDRFGGNFETINEQSLKELLDNVDVL